MGVFREPIGKVIIMCSRVFGAGVASVLRAGHILRQLMVGFKVQDYH